MVTEDTPMLHGFCGLGIGVPGYISNHNVANADEDLLRWISSEFYTKQGSSCSSKTNFNAAAKTMDYRARLAQMIGIGKPESEHSR